MILYRSHIRRQMKRSKGIKRLLLGLCWGILYRVEARA